jgi:Icc-related predicted phosphoesterase
MRLHVVSDVHARTDALARSMDGADALVCLGDLVLFLDYASPGEGIFGSFFGADNAGRYVALRTAGRFDEAREFSAGLWARRGEDRAQSVLTAVRAQYAEIFAAMPSPAFLTYGNVDLPDLWPEFLRPGHQVLDGQVVQIGARTVGFVGGGLRTVYRTPYEIDDEQYAEKVAAVEGADILCTHIPPALPDVTYDEVARRFERGSRALLDAIRRSRPLLSLFGHVHQPLVARTRVGRTECVNVGHFRGSGRPYAVDV